MVLCVGVYSLWSVDGAEVLCGWCVGEWLSSIETNVL